MFRKSLYMLGACLALCLLGACGREDRNAGADAAAGLERLPLTSLSEYVSECSEQYGLGMTIRNKAILAKESRDVAKQRYIEAENALGTIERDSDRIVTGDSDGATRQTRRDIEIEASQRMMEAVLEYLDTEPQAREAAICYIRVKDLAFEAFARVPGYRLYRLNGLVDEHLLRLKVREYREINIYLAERSADFYARGHDYESAVRLLEWALQALREGGAKLTYDYGARSSIGFNQNRTLRRELERKLEEYRALIPESANRDRMADEGIKKAMRFEANPDAPEFEELNRPLEERRKWHEKAAQARRETVSDTNRQKIEEAQSLEERGEYAQALKIWEELGDREQIAESIFLSTMAPGTQHNREGMVAKWVELVEKYPETKAGRNAKDALLSEYTQQGAYDKALEILDSIAVPEKSEAKHTSRIPLAKAEILLMAGRAQEALDVLKTVRDGMEAGKVHMRLSGLESKCHVRLGQTEQAIAVWQGFIDAVDAGAKITDAGEEERNLPGTPSPRVTAVSYAERQIAEIKGEIPFEDIRSRPFGIEER